MVEYFLKVFEKPSFLTILQQSTFIAEAGKIQKDI